MSRTCHRLHLPTSIPHRQSSAFRPSPRQSMRRLPKAPQPHSISSSWALLFRLVSARGRGGRDVRRCERQRRPIRARAISPSHASTWAPCIAHSNALQQDLQQDCNGLQMCVAGGKSSPFFSEPLSMLHNTSPLCVCCVEGWQVRGHVTPREGKEGGDETQHLNSPSLSKFLLSINR